VEWNGFGVPSVYKFITACKSCRDIPYGAVVMTVVSDGRPRFIFDSIWSGRFIIAAIVQGAVITGLTLAFVAAQILISGTNIIEFLSLSFEGPAKWIFLGYIFYMILVVAIAVSAVFYSHLEVGMGRRIRGFRSFLAWIHLVGMNVGGAATTIIMIFAGLAGSGVLGIIVGGSDTLQENTAIMDQFIAPIAIFTGVLSIGVISGGLAFVMSYLRKLPYSQMRI
jgi:hypothetical protein